MANIKKVDENNLLKVLGDSIYPGAKLESVSMVLEYCKAANLDPMEKPVHIVPMYDRNAKCMRDVVMPGIGLYRTQAVRSGLHAGTSEPIFGEDFSENLGGVNITYPAWCKVIVKKILPNGMIGEFSATERWKENYATQGKGSIAPNAMWSKRPYAQLAKCAESQALRRAFPDLATQPTAEEMEGREIDITPENGNIENDTSQLEYYSDEKFIENSPAWENIIVTGKKSKEDLISFLETKAKLTELQKEEIMSWGLENENA